MGWNIHGGTIMLVLSRKLNEKVLIGSNITIQVLEVRGNRIRLGIEAPGNVAISREELCNSNLILKALEKTGQNNLP
jgi:carbon storage regulator